MTSIRKRNTPAHLPSGPFGFSDDEWDQAKEEVRLILVDAAKKRKMIPYSDLVAQLSLPLAAHDKRFFSLLGEVSGDEHSEGRPLLSVLVVHKSGDMEPGPGFFELANELGCNTSDPMKFWVTEFKRVFEFWAE